MAHTEMYVLLSSPSRQRGGDKSTRTAPPRATNPERNPVHASHREHADSALFTSPRLGNELIASDFRFFPRRSFVASRCAVKIRDWLCDRRVFYQNTPRFVPCIVSEHVASVCVVDCIRVCDEHPRTRIFSIAS